ncbi:hypothetical protein ABEB36_010509 [Hypothenemus hampei]|uniref:Cytochrome P450 n=1 Tax=Hypothenemus hampei TaxID=57062 RepID=A0ABD1EJZ4_HYPHA
MFYFLLFGVPLVFIAYWYFYKKPYSYWKSKGVPQTTPWIFFGDVWPTLFRIKDMLEWINWFYNMHPTSKYVGMYQFYIPTLVIKDPNLIKQIAIKDFDHFTDHNVFSATQEIDDPLWGANLFTLKGQKWRNMRNLLSASFTSSKMKLMYTFMAEEAEKFVNFFNKQDEEIIEVDLKDVFTRYTNDVIASTSFGLKINSLENPNNEFYQLGQKVSNFSDPVFVFKFFMLSVWPGIFKLLGITFLSKKVTNFFVSVIKDAIRTREENDIVRPDMLNILLEIKNGTHPTGEEQEITDNQFGVATESTEFVKSSKTNVKITDDVIAAQAFVFFVAGFETVSSVMCFTCYELALNRDVQEQLRKEIQDVYDNSNGKPTYENIIGMKYMDMVVSESLRKWPPAPALDRLCVKPYVLQDTNPNEPPIQINKDDVIWVPTYGMHYDPKYFPNPEKFIPERFSDQLKDRIVPYTYLPFGIGPRLCIGSRFALLEVKSIVFHLVKDFEIVPTDKTQIPLKLKKSAVNVRAEHGFSLGLKRRMY